MTRLAFEHDRLYRAARGGAAAGGPADAQGGSAALVLAVDGPAAWPALSRVWQAVQAELDLPAPAIAVSGRDALQLWFSLEAPVSLAEGHAFLAGLQRRHLADVEPHRVHLWPSVEGAAERPPLPPHAIDEEHWAAVVAPDLAPLFAETPWLDVAPGDEAQAALLAGLRSITPAEFAAAQARLAATPGAQAGAPAAGAGAGAGAPAQADPPSAAVVPGAATPQAFLTQVMNDERVPLAQRIEAATALLRWGGSGGPAAGR